MKSDSPVQRSEFFQETKSIRAEMHSLTGRLALAIDKNQSDITDIRLRMATKEDIGRVLNAIDDFAHKNETFDRKVTVHDTRLNDHEERITRLENPITK